MVCTVKHKVQKWQAANYEPIYDVLLRVTRSSWAYFTAYFASYRSTTGSATIDPAYGGPPASHSNNRGSDKRGERKVLLCMKEWQKLWCISSGFAGTVHGFWWRCLKLPQYVRGPSRVIPDTEWYILLGGLMSHNNCFCYTFAGVKYAILSKYLCL
jgi:hypothetical protein